MQSSASRILRPALWCGEGVRHQPPSAPLYLRHQAPEHRTRRTSRLSRARDRTQYSCIVYTHRPCIHNACFDERTRSGATRCVRAVAYLESMPSQIRLRVGGTPPLLVRGGYCTVGPASRVAVRTAVGWWASAEPVGPGKARKRSGSEIRPPSVVPTSVVSRESCDVTDFTHYGFVSER